jgi:hypothetical protein
LEVIDQRRVVLPESNARIAEQRLLHQPSGRPRPAYIRQRCGFKGQAAELENACAYKSPSKQVISM